MPSPLLSVVMSVYNGENDLRGSIESIFSQTYSNFEFIIINDGSTDDSAKILKEYAQQDQRIVLIQQENIGLTRSLIKGIQLAKGKYIARQDVDDLSIPERFEKQLEWLEAHPQRVLCGSSACIFDKEHNASQDFAVSTEEQVLQKILCHRNPFFHSSVIFSRAAYEKVGGYRPYFKYTQDYDLWCRVSQEGIIGNRSEYLIKRVLHKGGISVQRLQMQIHYAAVASTLFYALRAYQIEINPASLNENLHFHSDSTINKRLQQYYHAALNSYKLVNKQGLESSSLELLKQSFYLENREKRIAFWLYAIFREQSYPISKYILSTIQSCKASKQKASALFFPSQINLRTPGNTILINGLSARQGGGQTYLLNLLQFFPKQDDVHVIVLAPESLKISTSHPNIQRMPIPKETENPFFRIFWENWRLPQILRQHNVNILFCPGGMLSTAPKGCKTAVTFQNMLPFLPRERRRYPWGYIRFRLWLLKFLQGRSFQKTDLLIYISQYAKNIIDQAIPEKKGTSVVIPHGLSDQFRFNNGIAGNTAQQNNHLSSASLPQEYVLYVSIIDVYKAQIEVVQAWQMFQQYRRNASCHGPEKLIFVGPHYPPYMDKLKKLIASLDLEEEIIILGKVPYEKLPILYQQAKINIFASSCENCPNILLEALGAGKPVLSSHYPPMPEFGEDAVEYFDPYDPQSLADLLLKYTNSPSLRKELGQKALKQSHKFQWEQTAQRTWDALFQLV
ncbi:MAG: glycosyltransferase [SAR324 cluster bacterium]|nr:glycosyltransferase [SAR324 cluster bacterium]